MAKIVIIGPAHPLRGGLATFNQRLARAFTDAGHNCSIYSFSLQYPSFLFPGKTQYTDDPAPEGIDIHTTINSINPLNWLKVGRRLRREQPDIILVRFWLPFMGPALGTILRQVKKNRHSCIICLADNVIPHEKRPGDGPFTRYFLRSCDAFITMSEKVMQDLRLFEKTKPARLVAHPLYDNFGEAVGKNEARQHLGLPAVNRLLLFFGFIRAYKGLDILLDAVSILRSRNAEHADNMRLLIAGEFYEDEQKYQQQIDKLGIRDMLILRTDFIPDSEVKYYLCAADVLIQPYRNATQSGVTPLAYHFDKPMIVTNVGGLPALVPHGISGLVAEPAAEAIADAIEAYFELGEEHFIPNLKKEKQRYSWEQLVETIQELSREVAGKKK